MEITKIKKLLKKLSVFDIGLLVLVGVVVVLGVLYSRREVKFINLRIKITDDNVLYPIASPGDEYANSFVVGDSEENELGQKVAEIVGVESYNIKPDKRVVILDVSAKAVYNPRKKQYSLRGKPVTFGSLLSFNFTQVKAKGIVIDFAGYEGDAGLNRSKMTVRTQLRWDSREFSDTYGVPDFVADAVKVGDEVKNSSGQVLAKVIEVETTPALRTVLNGGQMRVVTDPLLRDVFYTVELNTYSVDGKNYMFDYLPVLVNEIVPLNLPNISVFPVIIEIQ